MDWQGEVRRGGGGGGGGGGGEGGIPFCQLSDKCSRLKRRSHTHSRNVNTYVQYIITLLSPKRNLNIMGKSSQSSNYLWPRLASVSPKHLTRNQTKGKENKPRISAFILIFWYVSLVFRAHDDCFRDSKSVFCTLYIYSLEKETAFPWPPQKEKR